MDKDKNKLEKGEVSRRDFLVGAGAVVVGGAIGAGIAMVIHYSQFVDVQKALDKHQQYSPLDGLYRGNSKQDEWGWRGFNGHGG